MFLPGTKDGWQLCAGPSLLCTQQPFLSRLGFSSGEGNEKSGESELQTDCGAQHRSLLAAESWRWVALAKVKKKKSAPRLKTIKAKHLLDFIHYYHFKNIFFIFSFFQNICFSLELEQIKRNSSSSSFNHSEKKRFFLFHMHDNNSL